MEMKRPNLPSRRTLVFILAGVFVIALVVVLIMVFARSAEAPVQEQIQEPVQNTEVQAQSISGKYMFSGTIVLARAVENDAKTASGYDYTQPFSGISTFNPKQYDFWLMDWECPTTDKVTIPFAQQVANLQFNCRPEWLPEFNKHFDAVNLANNHSGDLGEDTFLETQDHLTKSGLQIVGNYDPAEEKDVCEIMSLPVHIKMRDGKEKDGKLPIAMCAWHYFFRTPKSGEIEYSKKYSDVLPTFGLMHVGVEYVATAGADQVSVARKIIDNGAEFVIGNSPHWVQNSEVYKGKPIFYSTGNFIFDQLEAETNRGLNIAVTLNADYDENVAKWLELGDACEKHHDDCLQMASEKGLQKINVGLTYEPVANVSGAHQITKKANATIQKQVEDRLNWQKTKQQLGQ